MKATKNLSFQETTKVYIDKNENINQVKIRQVMEPGGPTQERSQGTLQGDRAERATFQMRPGAWRTPEEYL